MGQEAGKPTWPKPAGGYQTITGRRYGRRHAYVSFRPSLMNQERYSNQHTEECEGLELDSVLKENLLCVCHIITNYYYLIQRKLFTLGKHCTKVVNLT